MKVAFSTYHKHPVLAWESGSLNHELKQMREVLQKRSTPSVLRQFCLNTTEIWRNSGMLISDRTGPKQPQLAGKATWPLLRLLIPLRPSCISLKVLVDFRVAVANRNNNLQESWELCTIVICAFVKNIQNKRMNQMLRSTIQFRQIDLICHM